MTHPTNAEIMTAINDMRAHFDRSFDALSAEFSEFKRAMSQNHFETVGRVKSTDERLDNHILHHR